MLAGRGFKKVYNVSGGIKAWNGVTAEGPVELNMDLIKGDETPVQIIKIAYGMEENLALFYRKVKQNKSDSELSSLLEKLAGIEDKHKNNLFDLLGQIEPFPPDRAAFEAEVTSDVLEGGFNPDDFMQKNEKFLHSESNLLDLAMMLEAQALDLYLRFSDAMDNQDAKKILHTISNEEKAHVEALGKLREKHS